MKEVRRTAVGVITAHLSTDLSGALLKLKGTLFPRDPLHQAWKLNCCSVDGLPTQSQSKDCSIVFKKAFHYETERGIGT